MWTLCAALLTSKKASQQVSVRPPHASVRPPPPRFFPPFSLQRIAEQHGLWAERGAAALERGGQLAEELEELLAESEQYLWGGERLGVCLLVLDLLLNLLENIEI